MGLGDEWTETTAGSASKLNQVTLTWGTGTYLAGLDKTKHKLAFCTATGSGLTINHLYVASTDGTEWLDLSDVNEHLHQDSASGGSFENVLVNNADVIDSGIFGVTNLTADSTGMYRQAVSGTGAHTTQTDGTTFERYIQADTGGTVSSTTSIHSPINLNVKFSKASMFEVKHKINTATSLAIKTGYGMENLSASDDNTRKYGAEVCTTVNNNWFAASANGTTRSSSDTGIAMTTNKKNIGCILDETVPQIELHVEGSAYTKTSNIPTNASANEPSRGAVFRYTTKNNAGSSRTFNFYGARLIYSIEDDSGWF